jgi:hypothetical protein
MKRALGRSFLFLAPLLLIALGMEWRLRQAPNFYAAKRQGLALQAPQLQVLVLGASQANQGIRAGWLDPHGYNLAHVGQDFHYDAALAEAWLPRLPGLRLVILPVAYVSMEYRFPGTPEAWRTFCYGIHEGLPNELLRDDFDPRQYSLLALTGPLQALRSLSAAPEPVSPPVGADGYQAAAPLSEEMSPLLINELTARKRVRYHHSIMREENRDANLADLGHLAALLAAPRWPWSPRQSTAPMPRPWIRRAGRGTLPRCTRLPPAMA